MSWKIYSLESCSSTQALADKAIPILREMGYTAEYTNVSSREGAMAITVDGVTYSCGINVANTTSYQSFLLVNDETNEIVICQGGRGFGTSNPASYVMSLALLHGTATKTGETGLFALARTDQSLADFANPWYKINNSEDQIFLQRAVFRTYTNTSGVAVNVQAFVSDLYFGTAIYDPGATCAVGSDVFLCLNQNLYAKL